MEYYTAIKEDGYGDNNDKWKSEKRNEYQTGDCVQSRIPIKQKSLYFWEKGWNLKGNSSKS